MKHKWISVVMCTASACLMAWLTCSCETSSGSGDTGLTLTPSSADVVGESAVLFTASGGSNVTSFLPLRWSVGDPSLGNIISSGSLSAVYRSNGRSGANSITVRDQAGNEGLALVNQGAPEPVVAPPEEIPLDIEPIPAANPTTTIVITNATSQSQNTTP